MKVLLSDPFIALFKGVKYSEGAEHLTVPHTPVPYSIENAISDEYESNQWRRRV